MHRHRAAPIVSMFTFLGAQRSISLNETARSIQLVPSQSTCVFRLCLIIDDVILSAVIPDSIIHIVVRLHGSIRLLCVINLKFFFVIGL